MAESRRKKFQKGVEMGRELLGQISRDEADELKAYRSYGPSLIRCYGCGRITIKGYVCVHCNDSNPSDPDWKE